ncbi:hypothetical protein FT641_18825 [Bacillus paranthracis]|uniref:hypothetical protein n=1 Tax=Bacillus paranthracis TaxID=2026186 RepID=UPI00187A7A61|nr:hypothetical protein [Bacillus paranthracis]MBE7114381.1 hypothetical protein [Bacillus paranthracis]MBE7154746.1 hypothetical protein [Bacillus paranthracis]
MTESPLDTLQGAEDYKKSIEGYIKELETDIFNEGKKMTKALEKAAKKGDWHDVSHLNHMIGLHLRHKQQWEDKLPEAKYFIERAGWIESGRRVIVDFLDRVFDHDMRWYMGLQEKYGTDVMSDSERSKLVREGKISKADVSFVVKTELEAERWFRLDIIQRYYGIIDRVEKKAGKIVDASHLHINAKGGIDGFVVGEIAEVQLNTIPAGGEIQRFHYRTLVKEVKGSRK